MTRLRTALHGLASLAALTALLAGVPWMLFRWGRTPDIAAEGWWADLTDSAVSDSTVFAVLTIAAWAAWAIFVASVTVEAVAGLRGVRAPRITLTGPIQHVARGLLAPILLLVSLAQHPPALATSTTPPQALPTRPDVTTAVVEDASTAAPAPAVEEAPAEATATAAPDAPTVPDNTARVVVVVERNDNPWRLAETHLGDGLRWRDLFEVNRGVPQPDGRAWTDPEVILPGWHLRLPTDHPEPGSPPAAAETIVHVVEPGDTLSGLAARYLGDPDRFSELFDANQHVVQPDGRRLTDPDLIVVGWHLAIPTDATSPPPPVMDPADDEATPAPSPPDGTPEAPTEAPPPTTTPASPPTSPPDEHSTPTAPDASAPPSSGSPPAEPDAPADASSPLPVLAGIAGAIALATGLALRMRWLRRRRATRDPTQRDLPPTPIEHAAHAAADEPLVRWAGQCLAAMVRALDRRQITAAPIAVELSEESGIELLWEALQQATPPTGWIVADGGRAWRHPYDPDDPVPADELPAAIPALVTIGHRDGRQLLIDLEAVGTLTVDGPGIPTRALAAAIAVELACGNDLADAYVTTVGLDLDPDVAPRHRLTATNAAGAAPQLQSARRSIDDVLVHDTTADTFQARTADSSPIEATIAVTCDLAADELDALSDSVEPRRGVALVACGSSPRHPNGTHIEIDPSGTRAVLEPLGIVFQPAGLDDDTLATVQNTLSALAAIPADRVSVPTEPGPPSNDRHPPAPTDQAPTASQDDVHTNGHDPSITADATVVGGAGSDGSPSPVLEDDASAAGGQAAAGRLFELPTPDGSEPELMVRVLGVPRIDQRPDIRRRELILAALLACRDGNLAASAAQDALWGSKPIEAKTMWNFVAKVRRALGDLDDGSPVMPAADRARGRLRLDPRVVTDLSLLRHATSEAATVSSAQALAVLRDALGLVEGPPFDAPGYDWAHRDQDVADAAAAIQQAIDQLIELAVAAGQLDIARDAISRGLRGLPGDEHLYRTRMRVESVAGNHAGIVAAYDELETYLADLETQPSPATTALYHDLIGSDRPTTGALR